MGRAGRVLFAMAWTAVAGAQGAPAPTDTLVRADSILLIPGNAAITGKVVDGAGKGIEGAEVRIDGIAMLSRTDADGAFLLALPPQPSMTLQIRRVGYQPVTAPVTVARGAVWEGRIVMQQLPQLLPEVRVLETWGKPARLATTRKFDEFYRRRAEGRGVFITREEFMDTRGRAHVLEFLLAKPGVVVSSAGMRARIMMPRCDRRQQIAVVVDGVRVRHDPWAVLDGMSHQDVEAMEVYAGLARVPAELGGVDVCGVVSVWMRDR